MVARTSFAPRECRSRRNVYAPAHTSIACADCGLASEPFHKIVSLDISEDRHEIKPKGLPVRRIGVVIKGVIALSVAMLWILLPAGTGYGQQSSAAVTGLVKDTSGAIISGTQVKIRNVETNTFRETVSNDAGNYTFLNVPPGRYTVEFSAKGFWKEHSN